MNADSGPPRRSMAFVVAAPITAEKFLAPHLTRLVSELDLTVIGNGVSKMQYLDPRINLIDVAIERRPNFISDFMACVALFRIFRSKHFHIVQSLTPKAGLLTSITAFCARIPARVHWFTGQVWVTKYGFSRLALKSIDRLIATLSTNLLVDSRSQGTFLMENKIASWKKMQIIANGSTCGVDIEQLDSCASEAQKYRKSLGIAPNDIVILFVGRLNKDKGIPELLQAFGNIYSPSRTHLVLLGDDEDQMRSSFKSKTMGLRNVIFLGHRSDVYKFLWAADIFVLPSHREGLPVSLLEAAAAGLPIVATNIYGITDVIEHDVNGLLVPVNNVSALEASLSRVILDSSLRLRLGMAARASVRDQFDQKTVVDEFREYITNL